VTLTPVSEMRAFGVAELDASGRLVTLQEEPEIPKSDMTLVGVYMFTLAVHEAVTALKPSWRGELEITEAIQWLLTPGTTCGRGHRRTLGGAIHGDRR
jgi:glucose-1-phosphate thymidylyltransferase